MNKSVYSIVLMDRVIEEIDKIAYQKGTNRSNLINQILAEHLNVATPENMIADTFSYIKDMLNAEGRFRISDAGGQRTLNVKSAISYKYNPTIKYSVKLNRAERPVIGTLKAYFRTQNEELLQILNEFYEYFIRLEQYYSAERFKQGEVFAAAEDGQYQRAFYLPVSASMDSNMIAQSIYEYVYMFDECLKLYFAYGKNALKEIEKKYVSYINNSIICL